MSMGYMASKRCFISKILNFYIETCRIINAKYGHMQKNAKKIQMNANNILYKLFLF